MTDRHSYIANKCVTLVHAIRTNEQRTQRAVVQ